MQSLIDRTFEDFKYFDLLKVICIIEYLVHTLHIYIIKKFPVFKCIAKLHSELHNKIA